MDKYQNFESLKANLLERINTNSLANPANAAHQAINANLKIVDFRCLNY